VWLRWIARGIGSLVAGFWLFIAVVSAIGECDPWTLKSAIMAGLIVASTLGVLLAWRRAGAGGIALLAIAVLHSVFALFAAGHHRGLAVLIAGGPFFVSSALFPVSWWRTRAP